MKLFNPRTLHTGIPATGRLYSKKNTVSVFRQPLKLFEQWTSSILPLITSPLWKQTNRFIPVIKKLEI